MKNIVKLSWLIAVAFLPGCIVIPVGDLLKGSPLEEQVLSRGSGWWSQDKIAVIDLVGVISGTEGSSVLFPQENIVSETVARLEIAGRDPELKAVVLRIGSPGGEVTACDALHHELLKFRKRTGIPVVASIGDVGASGGYYIAAGANVIVANPTAIVGSIGVILQKFDISGLFQKIGVTATPIKSSDKKDLGSPFRPMSPEEEKILQKLVNDMYQRFVDVVSDGRSKLKREEVLLLADGRVVSGVEAAALKLVDKTGYLSDAIEEAEKLADIKRTPTIVRYTRIAKSGANIYSEALGTRPESRELKLTLSTDSVQGPKLYYLWQPGF